MEALRKINWGALANDIEEKYSESIKKNFGADFQLAIHFYVPV